jgi:chaperonin cofactor prefoldin
MSIPNEALQRVSMFTVMAVCTRGLTRLQLLEEIEQKAAQSNQQIAIVKAQIAGKNRETRMIHLTTSELSSLPEETKVYEGVGRM